jgi:gamma-glutamyltranspeptidase
MPGFDWVDRPRDVNMEGDADHTGDTTYFAVVDQQRNAVSFTPSLCSVYGTKVVMVFALLSPSKPISCQRCVIA